MKALFLLFALVVIIAGFLFAGQSDYQEGLSQQDEYCQMVGDGIWPDFHGNYAEVCHGSLAQK